MSAARKTRARSADRPSGPSTEAAAEEATEPAETCRIDGCEGEPMQGGVCRPHFEEGRRG